MFNPRKNFEQKVVYRPSLWRYFTATYELFNRLFSFYFLQKTNPLEEKTEVLSR